MYSLQQTQSIGVIAHKIVISPYTSVTTPNDLVAILADSQITVSLQQKLMLALVTLIKEQKRHCARWTSTHENVFISYFASTVGGITV